MRTTSGSGRSDRFGTHDATVCLDSRNFGCHNCDAPESQGSTSIVKDPGTRSDKKVVERDSGGVKVSRKVVSALRCLIVSDIVVCVDLGHEVDERRWSQHPECRRHTSRPSSVVVVVGWGEDLAEKIGSLLLEPGIDAAALTVIEPEPLIDQEMAYGGWGVRLMAWLGLAWLFSDSVPVHIAPGLTESGPGCPSTGLLQPRSLGHHPMSCRPIVHPSGCFHFRRGW